MKLVIAAAALALTAGCVDGLTGASVDGEKAFMEDCAGCHGADAKGNGPMGEMLLKSPPDLTHLSANNGGVFPRDYVMSTIAGMARAPHFSAAMPEFGAGDMGPIVNVEGTPIPARLLALAGYLESVQE